MVRERLDVAAAKRVFEDLDTDGNGVIDERELEQGLRQLKLPVSKKIVGLSHLLFPGETLAPPPPSSPVLP